jgi:hypothetical protein
MMPPLPAHGSESSLERETRKIKSGRGKEGATERERERGERKKRKREREKEVSS